MTPTTDVDGESAPNHLSYTRRNERKPRLSSENDDPTERCVGCGRPIPENELDAGEPGEPLRTEAGDPICVACHRKRFRSGAANDAGDTEAGLR